MFKILNFRLPAHSPADTGAGAAVLDNAGAGAKTPEQVAAEKATADAAAAAAAAAGTKTPEQLAAEQATAAAETKRMADAAAAAAASKAPEKYVLTLPDGGRLEESDLKYVEDIARKANWSNDDAQAAIAEQDAAIKAQSDRFLTELKADTEYGGDKLAESQKAVRAVIDRIRPDGHPRREAFVKFLNRGGAGNHREVVAFFNDVHKLMAEDTSVGGGSGASAQDAASKLYGSAK